jgi:hypothetical protein
MNDLAKIALPASIALLGTLGGLLFAYRQSRRRGRDEAESAYNADKRAAYKTLWERLEDVHGYARGLSIDKLRFDTMLRDVNLQMLRAEVYLAPDERRLVNGYLEHLVALGTSAAAQSSATVQREVYLTGPGLSASDTAEFRELREAFARVDSDRESLLPRFRAALTGQPLPPAV